MTDNTISQRIETFFHKYPPFRFAKDDMILTTGEEITHIYYLRQGLVRQFLFSTDGNEATLQLFKPGSLFPIALALANAKNHYGFQATILCDTYRAPVADVIAFIKTDPEILFDMLVRFSRGLTGLSIKAENLILDNAYKRVISIIVYLAKEFGKKRGEDIVLPISMTHYDIASWVGVQRETVSRQLEKMVQKDLISYKNHVFTIKNLQKLEEENSL